MNYESKDNQVQFDQVSYAPQPATAVSPWRFSAVGAFWAVIALLSLFALFSGGGAVMLLVAVGAGAYAAYLFHGGRYGFIIW